MLAYRKLWTSRNSKGLPAGGQMPEGNGGMSLACDYFSFFLLHCINLQA
jgi:hypothetical protein